MRAYSELPNKQADQNKQAGMYLFFLKFNKRADYNKRAGTKYIAMFIPTLFLFTAYVVPNKRAGINFINSITKHAKNVQAGL